MAKKLCTNPDCDTLAPRLRRGLCPTCYLFLLKHGRHRVKADMGRPPRRTICDNCGAVAPPIITGLCPACYTFKRRTGRQRTQADMLPMLTHCTNCGAEAKKTARGLCPACSSYWYRHKAMRPIVEAKAPAGPRICPNCGDEAQRLSVGLCPACRIFWRRNGRHRTQADRVRSPGTPPRPCRHCKESFPNRYKHLCDACGLYWRTHGSKRPSYLHDDHPCDVCGRPKGKGFTKGRCPTCDSYYRKNGSERPPELIIKAVPMGWCDCGEPAIIIMELENGYGRNAKATAFPLCAGCAAAERAEHGYSELPPEIRSRRRRP